MESLIDLEGPMIPMTIINIAKEDSSISNIGSLLRMKGCRIKQAAAMVEVAEGMTMMTGI